MPTKGGKSKRGKRQSSSGHVPEQTDEDTQIHEAAQPSGPSIQHLSNHQKFLCFSSPPSCDTYLQGVHSHSARDLIENALFPSGVGMEHSIQACKRRSPTEGKKGIKLVPYTHQRNTPSAWVHMVSISPTTHLLGNASESLAASHSHCKASRGETKHLPKSSAESS